MAVNEACGLWMEQRIQEELDRQEETGNSLREIGRIVSAEVIKMFETKVSPRTLEKRAGRISATNVAPAENPTAPSVSGGDSGDISTADPSAEVPKVTADPVAEVHKEVIKGTPIREATRKVAEKTGQKPETVRKAYQRDTQRTDQAEPISEPEQKQPAKKEKKKKQRQDMKEVFPLSKISREFQVAYDNFMDELLTAKNSQWEKTSWESASHCVKSLHFMIGEKKP